MLSDVIITSKEQNHYGHTYSRMKWMNKSPWYQLRLLLLISNIQF